MDRHTKINGHSLKYMDTRRNKRTHWNMRTDKLKNIPTHSMKYKNRHTRHNIQTRCNTATHTHPGRHVTTVRTWCKQRTIHSADIMTAQCVLQPTPWCPNGPLTSSCKVSVFLLFSPPTVLTLSKANPNYYDVRLKRRNGFVLTLLCAAPAAASLRHCCVQHQQQPH